tara:strand:+ start:751 stop:2031 length:1281 start_codon:yes stop_codon:yes gene_type:complete
MFLINSQKKLNISVVTLLYLSLLVGFVLNEDTLGAAFIDYHGTTVQVFKAFENNFVNTFYNYSETGARHSPFFFIILYKLYYLFEGDLIFRLFFLHINLIIPYYFYKCLRIKFGNFPKLTIYLLPVIFLSPTFRSYAIWPDSFSFGLIFFTISTYYFLKFSKKGNFKNVILNILFLSLSAYCSPNFAIFSLYFFYHFCLFFNKDFNKVIIIIASNFFLASFALYYIFYLKVNFFQFGLDVYGYSENILSVQNLSNKILLVPIVIFFHSFVFFIHEFKFFNFNRNNFITVLIVVFVVILSFNNHDYSEVYKYIKGGGIFYKIFYELNYLYLIVIPSIISLFCTFIFVKKNINNFLIILIILLSNPQFSIYHNYFEPILYFFILFFVKEINFQVLNNKKIIFINLFVIIFYFISLTKESVTTLFSLIS